MQPLRKITGFLPYLLVVFINAFVDLGHKITIQNTIFKTWDGEIQIVLTALINGLILLPFILLFSPSGYLSDKYAKHKVIRWGAAAAIAATVLITYSYYMGWFWLAFLLTLALSIQSAIYSPAKYGYIRELVGDEKLASANGSVQAATIVAILAGTFVFSALFEQLYTPELMTTGDTLQAIYPLGFVLIALSLAEWGLALLLPTRSEGDKSKHFEARSYFKGDYLKKNLVTIRASKAVWLSIVGLSVFWGVSQVMLAAFPAHAKEVLGEDNTLVIQGLLAASGIGIMLGSLLAGRLSKAYLELGWLPLAAVGITGSLLVLPQLQSPMAIGLVFTLLGVCGGLFIVPLNALIQYSAKDEQLGTVLAGNNWVQNLTMLSFLILTVVFALLGFSASTLFYLLAAVTLVGSVYTIAQLPHSLARIIAGMILKRHYQISVSGFENLPKRGGVLLLGNHISWIDWALVQVACPRPVRFVMLRSIYETWYLKPVLKFFGVIPISKGNSAESLEAVNQCLRNGEVVCLFPEGAISRNGQLGQFKRGYERAVEGLDSSVAVITPFYLRGLWGSKLSRSNSEKLRTNTAAGAKRNIIVAFGNTLPLSTPAEQLKQKVFELSIDAWDSYTQELDTVPLAWLKQAKSQLTAISVVESGGEQYNNLKMITATTQMARLMRRAAHVRRQNVGLLLPSSGAGIMANLAVMLNGQTAVNLNYSTGADAVRSALDSADIDTIYTSSRFLDKLQAKGVDAAAMLKGRQVVYQESLLQQPSRFAWGLHLMASVLLPATLLQRLFGKAVDIEAPAQILFSSGSEGKPKGIVLSHRNLMGNIKQISDVLNTRADDKMMASLPLFHSFGLTVNSLLPMVEGIPAICHPDPTDAFGTAKAIARHKATILCGTASFLRLYTRNSKVEPLMLDSLRVVVAGAEKLTKDVRHGFELKFKKSIFEGYGTTETTPVASVNIPDGIDPGNWKVQAGQKEGSVGLPLPGSCFRIVDPETLESLPAGESGLILIAGGQVMLGYLNDDEKTADSIVTLEGRRWYKTGDKGYLDSDGFLTVVDRYSRFAKVGGEMISLMAVEQAMRELVEQDDVDLAAVSLPDEKKGEKIILLITDNQAAATLRQRAIEANLNNLMLPSQFLTVDSIPRLGSGKLDFSALEQLATPVAADE